MTIPFQKFYSNKLILISFLLSVYLLILLLLAKDLHGVHVEPLDLQFAYTPKEAYHIIDSYSLQTRKFYVLSTITLDLAYPIAYTIFLSFSMLALYPHRIKLAWLPYIIFGFDLSENLGIITLLSFYPRRINAIALITSAFTTMKWLASLVCLVFLLIGLYNKFLKKFIYKKRTFKRAVEVKENKLT